MKSIFPYIFPLWALLIVMILFYRWYQLRTDPSYKPPSCERYEDSTIENLPIRCYEYYGISKVIK